MGALISLLGWLSRGQAQALLRFLASLAFLLGIRRGVALANLRQAFPQLTGRERWRLAWANYRHLGTCAADFLRSPSMSDEELFALVDPGDWEVLDRLVRAGQGVVACTAHLGNFELLGVYAARRRLPMAILTKPLKGAANARWVGTRALAGIREIHKGMDNLVDSVKRGEALALLIDQNMLPKRAVFAPFFGKLAATTPAPAVVAERTGAPLVLTYLLRQPDGRYRVHVEGPFHFERSTEDRAADILAFTATMNERLQAVVARHPEQWFWVHRRWKTRPVGEGAPL